MRLTQYELELEKGHPILVKEKAFNYSEEGLDMPSKIVRMMNYLFRMNRMADERMYMIAFNNQMKPLGVFEIAHGTVNSSLLDARGIYIRALLCGATCITLVHNHPGMDSTPSKEDVKATEAIQDAGRLMNIPLLDHLIIGADYYSFKAAGML